MSTSRDLVHQALPVRDVVLFAPEVLHAAPREQYVAYLLLEAVHRVVEAVHRKGSLNRVGSRHLGGQSNEPLDWLSVTGDALEVLHKGTGRRVSRDLVHLSWRQRHGDRGFGEVCQSERLDHLVVGICLPAHFGLGELPDLGWLSLGLEVVDDFGRPLSQRLVLLISQHAEEDIFVVGPVRVVVDAALHLLLLLGRETEVLQAQHQPVEAPRTIQNAGVLNNIKPCRGIDLDHELHQLLKVRVVGSGAAVEAQNAVAESDPASVVELARACTGQALAFLTPEVSIAFDDSPDNSVEM